MYKRQGYYRMNRNSYDRNDVENFRRQVKEVFVPFAERVHEDVYKRQLVRRIKTSVWAGGILMIFKIASI